MVPFFSCRLENKSILIYIRSNVYDIYSVYCSKKQNKKIIVFHLSVAVTDRAIAKMSRILDYPITNNCFDSLDQKFTKVYRIHFRTPLTIKLLFKLHILYYINGFMFRLFLLTHKVVRIILIGILHIGLY